MNTSVLNMLRDSVYEKFAFVSDGIDVDFLRVVDELGDDDRMERRDGRCC
jgi:hypothetical protein